MSEPGAREVNGVPADQYGMWCPHGHRVMVPDASDTSEHPRCTLADPWPCTVCSPERLSAEMAEEAAEAEAALWDEYRAVVGGA